MAKNKDGDLSVENVLKLCLLLPIGWLSIRVFKQTHYYLYFSGLSDLYQFGITLAYCMVLMKAVSWLFSWIKKKGVEERDNGEA